jgi:hypothetical protein
VQTHLKIKLYITENQKTVDTNQQELQLFFVFRQALTMKPRLASNLKSSCLSFQSAGIIVVYHHTQPDYFINDKNVFHLDLGKDGTGV